ncbi:MAG: ATP-binding protein, partial [Bacteroidales bacterium]|nr:ATP-binding protein [Bacteroidales bacterium]
MKTAVINPFIISGYISATYFCDREKETGELLKALQNGRNVTLISPRRMGKTGLIHHLFHTLKRSSKDVVTIYVDLFSTTNLTEFTKLFADSVFGQLDSNPTKLLAKLTSFFKGLRPTIKLDEFTG